MKEEIFILCDHLFLPSAADGQCFVILVVQYDMVFVQPVDMIEIDNIGFVDTDKAGGQ